MTSRSRRSMRKAGATGRRLSGWNRIGGRAFLPALVLFIRRTALPQPKLLDDFETLRGWKPIASEGATLKLSSGEGKNGSAMVMEFDLTGGSGYTIAQKEFRLPLPPDYRFTFDMRAEAPVNNFEFKLLD